MDTDKIKITIHHFDNKYILKIGTKYHDEIPFITYIDAKNKAISMAERYKKDYEFIEMI